MRMQMLPILVAAIATAACIDLPSSNDNDDPIIDGDWPLDRPALTEVAPGQWLALRLTGVDVAPENIRMWVDDVPYPVIAAKRDGDAVLVRHPVLAVRPGPLAVALGTEARIRTGELVLDVVVPSPRYTRTEAAQLMARGFRALVEQVATTLDDPDPAVQAFLQDTYGANLEPLRAVFTELAASTAELEAAYLEIPEVDEPAIQAFLTGTGVLGIMEELVATSTMPAALAEGALGPADRMTHPVARVLYTLDATAAVLGAISDAVSIANLIAALFPGGQPLALVGFQAKVVIAVVRVVLDSLIPTDLVALEANDQPVLFSEGAEGGAWVYWGTFQPANGAVATGTFIIDQIYGLVIHEKLCPPQVKNLFETIARDLYSRVFRIIPNAIGRITLAPGDTARFTRVKILVNMQAYDLALSDLALLVPLFAIAIKELSFLFDFELVSPFEVTSATPEWAEDIEFHMDYGDDLAYITDVAPPATGDPRATVRVTADAYRFRPIWIGIASVPWVEWVPTIQHDLTVRRAPVPTDPNDQKSDEAWIVDNLGQPAPGVTPEEATIWQDTPTTRTTQLWIDDNLDPSFGGESCIDVIVNGEVQIANLCLPETALLTTIQLRPGKNTLAVHAVSGYESANSRGFHLSFELGLPDSRNTDKFDDFMMNAGDVHEKTIWTPPAF